MSTLKTNQLANLAEDFVINVKEVQPVPEAYTSLGAYGAGLVFNSYIETFTYAGGEYRPLTTLALPYTTTGAGAGEIASFSSVGDAVLRSDLAEDSNPLLGSVLVGRSEIAVTSIAQMQAYSVGSGRSFSINAGGRSGVFDVISGNFSAELAADTLNGIYVGLSDDPTATTKVAKRRDNRAMDVQWFGAVGDGITDDTAALQAALDQAVYLDRAVYLSPGNYRTTSELTIIQNPAIGNAYGFNILGENSTWSTISAIYADHTGPAILNLKGANGCWLQGIKLHSNPANFPKCGLVLGRDVNVDSCGWHNIRQLWIDGNFSVAGIYSIASEENIWADIFIQLRGGGAKYGFYSSTADALLVDSLPSSSNIANFVSHLNIWNWQLISDSACVYLETDQAMGSWSFTDCYCIPKSGSYYQISNGLIGSGLAPLGPFSFIGCGGEIYAPVSPFTDTPNNAFRISSATNRRFTGLTILGSRCQLINADGTRKILNVDANLSLIKPNIVIQPLEDPTIGFSVFRAKIEGGIFDVADSSDWVPLTFSTIWANSFGAPYAPAAYQVDNTGTFRLRGTVTNSSTGDTIITVLPGGLAPKYQMLFATQDGTANAKILIKPNGEISLSGGTGAEVQLSNVAFKLEVA